jgi:aldehyde:ferredoxin oxidoreductase
LTGVPFTADDLMRIGERVWNLERLYNLREGFTRAEDTLPRRLLEEPVSEGPSKGYTVQLEPMLEEYYQFRSWDTRGVPSMEKLKELSLGELVEGEGGSA